MYKFFLLIVCISFTISQDLTIEKMMSKPYLWGERVGSYDFSPTSDKLYYSHKNKNFSVNLFTLKQDSLEHRYPRNWDSDESFIYRKKGKTIRYNVKTQAEDILFDSDKRHQFFHREHVTYLMKDSTLYVTTKNRTSQLTLKSEKGVSYYISSVSKNGNYAFIASYKRTKSRTLYFPDYLPQFTKPGKQTRQVSIPALYMYDLKENKINEIYAPNKRGYISRLQFSDDERFAVFKFSPISRKTVSFFKFTTKSNTLTELYKASSEKWVVGRYDKLQFSPDSKTLLFLALNESNTKLFTHDLSTDDDIEIRTDEFDVMNAFWKTSDNIVFISNKETPLERHIYLYSLQNENATKLSVSNGYIRRAKMSSNGKYLAYQFSTVATPDELYLFDLDNRKEHKISNTIPSKFHELNVSKQELLKTRSKDDQFDIYANFYSSDTKKKPLVVFVHGAGILQNVLNGWTPAYHREFLFHQMLIKKGYHVLDVDYRGSIGYSHDFSTDVHSHLGKKELEDIVSFIELLDTKGLIHKDKVGIYGGSYGGFMTSYAMAFEPDLFKAGAALRSVFNWENYYYTNEWYTRARLDVFESHKEWYKRSSPLYHVDKIKHPMLILHGMMDDNVPFQDAVQMTQKMIDGHKTFDLMMYPKEKHSFRHPNSWIDEYKRIFDYFEKYLK